MCVKRENHPVCHFVAASAFPVKGPFLPGKEDCRCQDGNEDKHIKESDQADFFEDDCPREHVDHLHVKGHKEQSEYGIAQAELDPGLMSSPASVLRRRILLCRSCSRPHKTAQAKCQQA